MEYSSIFRDAFTPAGFISPNSAFQEKWDVLILVLLLYVMTVTPFEVSFLPAQAYTDVLFWVNRVVDSCFMVDMICQFFMIPGDLDVGSMTADGTSRKLSAHLRDTYLKGWFFIDFISILPYDLISWLVESSAKDGGNVHVLRLMRIVKLARLFKTLRVLRVSRLVTRYDDRVGISFSKLRVWKYLFFTMISSHWLACMLRIVPIIEDDPSSNWIVGYFGSMDVPPFEVYNVAWYWSIMTMSSVGYGDVLPQTQLEVLASSFVMCAGAFVFMFILGSVASIVASSDQQENQYYTLRDTLNDFTEATGLPPALCYKLRHFVRKQYQQGSLFDWSAVLDKLSPQLRMEVAMNLRAQYIVSNNYFKDCTNEELAGLASVVQQKPYAIGEALITQGDAPTQLFIIQRGMVVCQGKVYGPTKVLGDDMFYFVVHKATANGPDDLHQITEPDKKVSDYERMSRQVNQKQVRENQAWSIEREYRAVAVCFSVVNCISEEGLLKVFRDYPDLLIRVRRAMIRNTFRRHVLAYAKAYLSVQGQASCLDKHHMDRKLVGWYEEKVQMSLHYDNPQNVHRIITLQNAVRSYLGRNRMRKVIALLRLDPQHMHQEVMASLKELDCRLSTQEGSKAAAVVPVVVPAVVPVGGGLGAEPASGGRAGLDLQLIRQMAQFIAASSDAQQIATFQAMMELARKDLEVAQGSVGTRPSSEGEAPLRRTTLEPLQGLPRISSPGTTSPPALPSIGQNKQLASQEFVDK